MRVLAKIHDSFTHFIKSALKLHSFAYISTSSFNFAPLSSIGSQGRKTKPLFLSPLNDIEFTPVYFADANQCKSKDDPRKNKSSDDFKTYQDYLDYKKALEGDRPHCPAVICIGI